MESKFEIFLVKMNNHHWLRALVLLLPGLILSKASAMEGTPHGLRILSTAFLCAGVAVYALWKRIMRKYLNEEVDETNEEEFVAETDETLVESGTALLQIDALKHLLELYNGDDQALFERLSLEASLNPLLPLSTVIEQTYHRRTHEVTRQSGSSK